ncbi:sensor histidine kinase [Sorangium sp. So ce1128]
MAVRDASSSEGLTFRKPFACPSPWLSAPTPFRLDEPSPGSGGPFELRRTTFRQGGLPHHFIVLTDLRRALREEERQAWQRLIRVLSHEINNSLAPIRSIAEGQRAALSRDPRPDDWEADLLDGLAVIARRSEALGRFMTAYARLARLPPPSPGTVNVRAWVTRVAALEKRLSVSVDERPAILIPGDEDQLDQLLINLVRDAADAALETGGQVRMRGRMVGARVEIAVEDEGPGLPESGNLFVPFFTTKPQGSGIGLLLSRQIAEAHGGLLKLENRIDVRGCIATLALPLGDRPSALLDERRERARPASRRPAFIRSSTRGCSPRQVHGVSASARAQRSQKSLRRRTMSPLRNASAAAIGRGLSFCAARLRSMSSSA